MSTEYVCWILLQVRSAMRQPSGSDYPDSFNSLDLVRIAGCYKLNIQLICTQPDPVGNFGDSMEREPARQNPVVHFSPPNFQKKDRGALPNLYIGSNIHISPLKMYTFLHQIPKGKLGGAILNLYIGSNILIL